MSTLPSQSRLAGLTSRCAMSLATRCRSSQVADTGLGGIHAGVDQSGALLTGLRPRALPLDSRRMPLTGTGERREGDLGRQRLRPRRPVSAIVSASTRMETRSAPAARMASVVDRAWPPLVQVSSIRSTYRPSASALLEITVKVVRAHTPRVHRLGCTSKRPCDRSVTYCRVTYLVDS